MKKLCLLLAIVLTACTQTPSVTPTPLSPILIMTITPLPPSPMPVSTTRGPSTPAVSLTPAAPIDITITAPDGTALAASFYAAVQSDGGKAPAVLLLPMLGRPRADWDLFARELQKRGIAALTLDHRGQGQSGGTTDWTKASADVRAAWDALMARPGIDRQNSAIVGASIGANLALIVGANTPAVTTVIALSPGLDYHEVKPLGVMPSFGQRPVFLLASRDDAYAYDSTRQLTPLAPKGEAYYFAKAGHGTDMFSDPTLTPLLLDWLEKNLGVLKG